MPSTYTVNLGIEKPATGEQSGTWGDTTNVNFDLIDQAVNGSVRVTLTSAGTSGSPNDLNIVNGSTTSSEGRNKWIEIYSASDLGGSAYVRLVPNDAEKILFIRNSLAGSQSVLLFQGTYNASNDLEIPAGVDMVVRFDGAGASATVTDVFTKLRATEITTPTLTAGTADINGGSVDGATVGAASASTGAFTTLTASTSLNIASSTTVDGVLDEDNMASDSATKLATQQSIKAYVDSQVGTVDTLAEILANGNTSGANNLIIDNGQALTANTINETTAGTGVTIDSVLLKDDVVNATDIETSNISANDGTAAATIANSTGNFTITNFISNSVDIGGGAIDGTNIGASSAATGTFTTFTSTGIDDNATSTAITIDSSQNVGIGTTSALAGGILSVEQGSGTHAIVANSDTASAPSIYLRTIGGTATESYITFNDSTALAFTTTSAERMRIDSSGNVGIGTASPSSLGLLAVGDGATGTKTIAINGSGSSTSVMDIDFRGGGTGGPAGRVRFESSTKDLSFWTGNYASIAQRMTITDAGNVGIGTSSPNATLAFGGSSDVAFNTSLGSTGTYGQIKAFNTLAPSNPATNIRFIRDVASIGNDGAICFDTVNTERMRIDSSGNVGIGTSSPTGVLTSYKSTDGDPVLGHFYNDNAGTATEATVYVTNSSTVSHGLFLQTTGTAFTTNGGFVQDGSVIGSGSGASGGLSIMTRANAPMRFYTNGHTNERMRIDSSGNVGISTTSPGTKLHIVAGSSGGSLTEGLRVSDNTYTNVQLLSGGADGEIRVGASGVMRGVYKAQFAGTRTANTFALGTNSTNAIFIDTSQNVGIGTDVPDGKLNVFSASAGSVTADADADELVLENSGNVGLSLLTASTGESGIYFGNPGTNGQKDFYLKFYHESHATTANRRAFTFNTGSAERMRINSSGNLLLGTTSETGHFTNGLPTATLSTGSTGGTSFVRTHRASSSNNATVDAFRFLDANGNVNNGYVNGHLYVTVNGSSGLYSSTRMYYIQTNSNGTLNSNFTLISTATRGTDPVSSIAMVNDGGSGAVKIQITYINNGPVVDFGYSTITFIGQA